MGWFLLNFALSLDKTEDDKKETTEKPPEQTVNEFQDPYNYDFLLNRINEMIKGNNSALSF